MWDAQLPALAGPDGGARRSPGPRRRAGRRRRGRRRSRRAACSKRPAASAFSFVGLSLGGAVGMRLALDAPERLERLVLACTSARFGEPAQWLERAATVRAYGLGAIVDAVLARWFTPSFDDVDAYREHLPDDRSGGLRALLRGARALRRPRSALGASATPTLVVAGADDPVHAARRGRGGRPEHPERALRGDRRRGAPRERRAARRVQPTAGGASCEPRRRHARPPRGARRRARRSRDRADDGVHRRLPGSDHALRVGRDLGAARASIAARAAASRSRRWSRSATTRSSRCTSAPRCATA